MEPTEAMLQAEIDAVSDYWTTTKNSNRTEATKVDTSHARRITGEGTWKQTNADR